MRFPIRPLGIIVGTAILGAAVLVTRQYKTLSDFTVTRVYQVSRDCQNWLSPGSSFTQYLQAAAITLKSPFEPIYLRLDSQAASVLLVSPRHGIATGANGIFKSMVSPLTGLSFIQAKDEVAVKAVRSERGIWDQFKTGVSEKNNVALLQKRVDSRWGIVFVDGSADRFYCASRGQQWLCFTPGPEKVEVDWNSVLEQSPQTREALDLLCNTVDEGAAELEQLSSRYRLECKNDSFQEPDFRKAFCAVYRADRS